MKFEYFIIIFILFFSVSDENHEKSSKKDLLIGKRKDKKDKGYATLEGESSPEDESETK